MYNSRYIIFFEENFDEKGGNYRSILPQKKVREEMVEGMGTRFDPEFARIMIRMIDRDTEYKLKETVDDLNIENMA